MNGSAKTISRLCLIAGLAMLLKASYMNGKALLAQILISSSWEIGLAAGTPQKPWWWADTQAIAELKIPSAKKKLYVMQDDSGESLAFGPGHLSASAKVSTDGHVMISGHRDTHFSFLRELSAGDEIETQDLLGAKAHYQVIGFRILDINKDSLLKHDDNLLSLITCYPFDDFVPGGPLRFIVDAQRIDQKADNKPNQSTAPTQALLTKA